MSDYDELKKELHRISKEVSKKHNTIQQIADELNAISTEKQAAETSFNTNKSADYNTKYKEHLNSLIGPIEQNIELVKHELEDEETEFRKEFGELTAEKFMEQCTDTQELCSQVQEMSLTLKTQLQDLVGTRLYNNVSENLKTDRMKLDVTDLDRVIAYFNECEDRVSAMVAKPDYVRNFVTKMESTLQSLEFGKSSIFVSLVFVIVFILLYKHVSPIYTVFICAIAVFHLFRTYSIYEILLTQKGIVDNIDAINEKLQEDATREAEYARAELQQAHEEQVQLLQNKLNNLTAKKDAAIAASKDSFFYDGSQMQSAFDSKLVNLDKREADALANKMKHQKELEELMNELESIKCRMDKVFSKQQNAYLNYETAGEQFVLDRKFLLDIDDVTKKLTYFSFPEHCSLFIYKDREEAVNLIRLFNVQIRSRLHPLAYEVVYYDSVNLGQDCYFFVPETSERNDPAERLFRIISDSKECEGVVHNYSTEMRNRQKNFRQDGSIDAYNKHMLEIDSLAIPYYFSFILDPEDSLIKSFRMITSSGTYGIYLCVFISEKRLCETGSSSKDIIDIFSQFFAIQNGKVNNRAKDFVLDMYSDKKVP